MARIPAREWRAADRCRDNAAIAAALGLDLGAVPHAWYALLPFVILQTDDGPVVAGTTQPPLPLTVEEAWYEEDTTSGPSDTADVITLSADGAANLHRQRVRNHLLLPNRDPAEHLKLYTDGRTFFRAWVSARVRWLDEARVALRDYRMEIPERSDGCMPGALLIGEARRVSWPSDRTFICPNEELAREVNRGIVHAARLSRAVVAATSIRRAA